MRVRSAALVCSLSSALAAQACPWSAPTFATQSPFGASFFYGPYSSSTDSVIQFFDLDVQAPLTVTAMRGTTYDQGPPSSGNPDQVGATGTVRVLTIPGTSVGMSGSPAGWTQIATGTITVTAWPASSPITFATPFTLPAGSYGVAIELLATTAGNSPNPGSLHVLGEAPDPTPAAADQFLAMHNERIQQVGWQSVSLVAGINLEFDYTPDPTAARWSVLGDGCYTRPRGFYEVFGPQTSPPDLAHTAISLQPLGTGPDRHWTVAAGSASYAQPSGTRRNAVPPAVIAPWAFGQWDDALDTPIQLPFQFDFPGGSTNVVTAGSNGILFLAAVADPLSASFFLGDAKKLGAGAPFLAPAFGDLDLDATLAPTGLYHETDNATWVRISWHDVVEFGQTTPQSMQVTLWSDGHVDIAYDALDAVDATVIAGFLEAQGERMPAGAIDLSAALPFTSGDGVYAPALALDQRPVLGTTFVAATSEVMPGTTFALMTASLAPLTPPLDLVSYGMPGCRLHVDPALAIGSTLLGLAPSQRFEFPVAVPNDGALQGLRLTLQSAPLTAGWNPAGALVSNGVCARLGL